MFYIQITSSRYAQIVCAYTFPIIVMMKRWQHRKASPMMCQEQVSDVLRPPRLKAISIKLTSIRKGTGVVAALKNYLMCQVSVPSRSYH